MHRTNNGAQAAMIYSITGIFQSSLGVPLGKKI
jgi:hypothetical protein